MSGKGQLTLIAHVNPDPSHAAETAETLNFAKQASLMRAKVMPCPALPCPTLPCSAQPCPTLPFLGESTWHLVHPEGLLHSQHSCLNLLAHLKMIAESEQIDAGDAAVIHQMWSACCHLGIGSRACQQATCTASIA